MSDLNEVFARHWGCDLSTFKSHSASSYDFQIRSIGLDSGNFDGSIHTLKLRYNGRWGNYVLQLINMFHLAEKLGCKKILIHSTEMFPILKPRHLGDFIVDSVRNPSIDTGFELESVFFKLKAFGSLVADLTPDRRRQLALRYVRPLLTASLASIESAVGRGDLVIHIRSGDIFEGPEGQGGSQVGGSLYTQPPLAFYLKVAEAALGRGAAHSIIVSENSLNPTIFPLVEKLQRLGFAVTLRLQHDLASDLNLLLAATQLVLANGTIGIAVALLSETMSDAYFFRKNGTGTDHDVDHFLGDFVRKHYLIDDQGFYIPKGEWKNTAEQRMLMLNLQPDHLSWEEPISNINIAAGKPTRQSSISIYSQPDESGRAVTEGIDVDYAFHTDQESFPWWEVNLTETYPIYQIVIFNRDTLPERAYCMQVFVLDAESRWLLVHDQGGRAFGGRGGKPCRIALGGFQGRAVRIQLPAFQFLHLRKVEVFSSLSSYSPIP